VARQQEPARRGRGRPRAGSSDARAKILEAASEAFAHQGYDATTVREVAAAAGVDPALVHHHFGSKADLFGAATKIPMRPDKEVPAILAGPREEVGARIVRYVLTTLEDPAVRRRAIALVRTAVGNKAGSGVLVGFLSRELIGRIAHEIGTPDAGLRSNLVASQVVGMLVARYVIALPDIAEAGVEELVQRIGPTIQRYLFEDTDDT
jgi:AcrR family transcriptional regulator